MTDSNQDFKSSIFENACRMRGNRSKPVVAIIDDDEFIRDLVLGVLRKKMDIVSANTGKSGIELYSRTAPNLLLLDINMPDMSGIDVLREIMAMDRDACVIMFSARSTKDNISTALEIGAKGFITKPFTASLLQKRVNKALKGEF